MGHPYHSCSRFVYCNMLRIQELLKSGKTPAELTAELGLRFTWNEYLPLVIVNYHQFESPRRHPVTDECRGLVLQTGAWDLVAGGFRRFYNLAEFKEEDAAFNWGAFSTTEKVDGSVMLAYWFQGEWRVSTRGSFAEGIINPNLSSKTWRQQFFDLVPPSRLVLMNKSDVLIFELVSTLNQVVRRYEKPALYLLTVFELFHNKLTECGSSYVDGLAQILRVNRPQSFDFASPEQLYQFLQNQERDDPTFEGFVLRDNKGRRLKVKSRSYVALHAFKNNGAGFNCANLVPLLLRGQYDDLVSKFPEHAERLRSVNQCLLDLYEQFAAEHWQLPNNCSQKEYALAVQALKSPLAGLHFEARKRGMSPDMVFGDGRYHDRIAGVVAERLKGKD